MENNPDLYSQVQLAKKTGLSRTSVREYLTNYSEFFTPHAGYKNGFLAYPEICVEIIKEIKGLHDADFRNKAVKAYLEQFYIRDYGENITKYPPGQYTKTSIEVDKNYSNTPDKSQADYSYPIIKNLAEENSLIIDEHSKALIEIQNYIINEKEEKEKFKKEIKDDVTNEMVKELKEELKPQVEQELRAEMKEEVRNEVKISFEEKLYEFRNKPINQEYRFFLFRWLKKVFKPTD